MQNDDHTNEPTSDDPTEDWRRANETVTNDAVAGETVLPGAGDGNFGPTGGSPSEAEPILDEHDPLVEFPDRVETQHSNPLSDANDTAVTEDDSDQLDISEQDGPEL